MVGWCVQQRTAVRQRLVEASHQAGECNAPGPVDGHLHHARDARGSPHRVAAPRTSERV